MGFETYFTEVHYNNDKLYYNYLGIIRKEYPKWAGWKIISNYKGEGVDIKDINDECLDTLVKNFYYLKYIEERLELTSD